TRPNINSRLSAKVVLPSWPRTIAELYAESRERRHASLWADSREEACWLFSPSPSRALVESAKTIVDLRSCSACGPTERRWRPSCPATPGLPPAHTSSAAPGPGRQLPANAARKSWRPGRTWWTTSRRTALAARTSGRSLLANLLHNGCRWARTSALRPRTATYSAQLLAFSWLADLFAAKRCPRRSPSG